LAWGVNSDWASIWIGIQFILKGGPNSKTRINIWGGLGLGGLFLGRVAPDLGQGSKEGWVTVQEVWDGLEGRGPQG